MFEFDPFGVAVGGFLTVILALAVIYVLANRTVASHMAGVRTGPFYGEDILLPGQHYLSMPFTKIVWVNLGCFSIRSHSVLTEDGHEPVVDVVLQPDVRKVHTLVKLAGGSPLNSVSHVHAFAMKCGVRESLSGKLSLQVLFYNESVAFGGNPARIWKDLSITRSTWMTLVGAYGFSLVDYRIYQDIPKTKTFGDKPNPTAGWD